MTREAGNADAERGPAARGQEPRGARELRRRAGQGTSRGCSSLRPHAHLPWRLTSSRTGSTVQGWGAALCRRRPSLSWPINSREKGPAVDRSAGGSEAARRPRSRGPVGSRGTRPRSAPSGTPRRTTWEKCGRGSPGLRLEPSPVTSTSSWVWRPGTGDGRGERWSAGDSETGRKRRMAFGIGVIPGENGWIKGATSEGYCWAGSGKILGCWKRSKS